MSRRKRNKDNTVRDTDGYIKKYFGADISKLLIPQIKNIQNCPIPYVNHQEAEKVLGEYLKGDEELDKAITFTGLTGSGKTTILRHVFGIEENSNKARIDGKTIVIPIDFNRSHITAEIAILSSVRSAFSELCRIYGIKEPGTSNTDFFEYIKSIRDDFLHIEAAYDSSTDQETLLRAFMDKAPVAYASCQLQYVLSSDLCDINLVVLIVDNVEGYAGSGERRLKYLNPIIEALRLYDCISQRKQPTKWCFNMVIACRHYVLRLMKGEEEENGIITPLLQSFLTSNKEYDLRKPVELNKIVEKRENVFSRDQSSERWITSVHVVKSIFAAMEGKLGDFVLQMELKNIRRSLDAMQKLILHSGLQKKTEEEINSTPGAFQISADNFDLSRVNLIKTIGVEDSKYYSGKGLVPNLLYNQRNEGLELYPLLTIKYFLKKCGYEEPSWDNSVSISEFYSVMKDLFDFTDQEVDKLFGDPVRYFLLHRILLRSADQQQEEVPGIQSEIERIESVYISGAAVVLWQELSISSALFQLYMDDVYVESNSEYLQPNGNDIEHCFSYLKYLREKEKRIYNQIANVSDEKVADFIECFGKNSICGHLAKGLLRSLQTIVNNDKTSQRGRNAEVTKRKIEAFIRDNEKWK